MSKFNLNRLSDDMVREYINEEGIQNALAGHVYHMRNFKNGLGLCGSRTNIGNDYGTYIPELVTCSECLAIHRERVS